MKVKTENDNGESVGTLVVKVQTENDNGDSSGTP